MIIVHENNCQVQSDIFFVAEELRNIDKQAYKSDISLRSQDSVTKPPGSLGAHDAGELREEYFSGRE